MLRVSDLVKVYPSGDRALDGVSMTVSEQQTVAVIGPSGAGKSTLIRCINRLVEPTEGTIHLGETEITSLSKRELRKARRDMGMVFQEYGLVERLTVMENVLSGRLGYTSTWAAFRRLFAGDDVEAAYSILERVGLAGYENNRADELSGGQRQRVGIARAIIQRPKILLVDEPTSSLDPETSDAVMELLVEVADEENIPVLINIHDVHLAEEYADRIVGITDGAVVFDGSPSELDDGHKDEIYRGDSTDGPTRSTDDPDDTVPELHRP